MMTPAIGGINYKNQAFIVIQAEGQTSVLFHSRHKVLSAPDLGVDTLKMRHKFFVGLWLERGNNFRIGREIGRGQMVCRMQRIPRFLCKRRLRK